MAKQDNHFRVMSTIRFWHISLYVLDVGMPLSCFFNANAIGIFPTPGAVHELDFDQTADIDVELSPEGNLAYPDARNRGSIQDEFGIKQIVEEPALFDQWVTKDAAQADSINITGGWKLLNEVELEGG